MTDAPLGDKIENPTDALCVARVPVLHCGVFDFCIIHGNQFNHRGVQLVLIARRGRAALQITHITAFVSH